MLFYLYKKSFDFILRCKYMNIIDGIVKYLIYYMYFKKYVIKMVKFSIIQILLFYHINIIYNN